MWDFLKTNVPISIIIFAGLIGFILLVSAIAGLENPKGIEYIYLQGRCPTSQVVFDSFEQAEEVLYDDPKNPRAIIQHSIYREWLINHWVTCDFCRKQLTDQLVLEPSKPNRAKEPPAPPGDFK